jgi:outer membrane protein OmpA-like peptidoglycan-associated protein
MRGRRIAATLLLCSAAPVGAAEPPYAAGPWDPATEQAAEAAVARLGGGRALEIQPVVLRIVGLEARGIVATVQEVRQAMQALRAEESDLEVRVELPADVLFDFDSADIRPDAAQALGQLATVIRGFPDRPVEIEGHTDSQGDDGYNQRLSERRAESVKRWLVEREVIAGRRLATRGEGEKRPVADNESEQGRQRNRRVEVVIRKAGRPSPT